MVRIRLVMMAISMFLLLGSTNSSKSRSQLHSFFSQVSAYCFKPLKDSFGVAPRGVGLPLRVCSEGSVWKSRRALGEKPVMSADSPMAEPAALRVLLLHSNR